MGWLEFRRTGFQLLFVLSKRATKLPEGVDSTKQTHCETTLAL